MITLDFFLYDNRTWAPRIGRDWGIKAATGILTSRLDLQLLFECYCGALPSDHGYLSAFGSALGGIRPRRGDGYLLCVTLETSDTFNRPSWAVYGLWCPDTHTLRSALEGGDLIAAVQATLGAEAPPPAINVKASRLVPRRPCRPSALRFRRFNRATSVSEVTSRLLDSIESGTQLASVLGITASSRLSDLGRQFAVVFCHPQNDRAELAFQQHQGDEAPFARDGHVTSSGTLSSRSALRMTILSALGLGAVAALLLAWGWPQRPTLFEFHARPPAPLPRRAPISAHPPETALREIRIQVDKIAALDPADLRKLARNDNRRKLDDACTALIADRARIVGRPAGEAVARYYEEPQLRSFDAAQRLHRILQILDERPLGIAPCKTLDMNDPTIQRWCGALTSLERTAQSLREIPSNSSPETKS